MPQVREHRHTAEEGMEFERAESARQKVRVVGHLKVRSWASTVCCSSPPRSRTSSPSYLSEKVSSPRREDKEEKVEEREEAGDDEQRRLRAGLCTPRPSFPRKVTPSSTSAGATTAAPLASDPDIVSQSVGLPPPPGLPLPPGLSVSTTPPVVTDLVCGVCDERAVPNLGVEDQHLEGGTVHLSVGSVGHPYTCAAACRYVKRKGGCRDGSKCQHCHLCFWSRPAEKNAGDDAAQIGGAVVSIGTRGHPHNCGAACKYARRKGGCRDGANCVNCHACLWQRERPKEAGMPQEAVVLVEQAVVPVERAPQPTPEEAKQSFFGDSADKLAELIAELLSRQEVGAH